MLFDDPALQTALAHWRALTDVERRAEADNLWFELRVSDARRHGFEEEAFGAVTADELSRAQTDYCRTFVQVGDDVAHTFINALDPANLGMIDEMQRVVRIKSLVRPLNAHGISFVELKKAFDDNDVAVIDGFLRTWNDSTVRDWRPAFAAFKDEVVDDLAEANWPDRLRDRLGLAHYDCAIGPVPVALMEYSVAEVNAVAGGFPAACPFTAPTVLDSVPWPYFFPAPTGLSCGRTMALYEVADDKELLAEILHFRIPYKVEHIARLDEIRSPPRPYELRTLRNHHLLAVRIASGDDRFGEDIPA